MTKNPKNVRNALAVCGQKKFKTFAVVGVKNINEEGNNKSKQQKNSDMKHTKLSVVISALTVLLILSACSHSNAQCNAVSGMSGTVHDNASTISVNYTVSLTTGASFINLGVANACGFSFPGISAPWCGNTNIIDTVTYTFSSAIISIDVFLAYVGVTGNIRQESFTFITNGSTPALTVDSGTCAAWIVAGNQTTSPAIPNGLNAVVTAASALPFTTLGIISGTNSSMNGGASYGLCDASVTTSIQNQSFENEVHFYPNPVHNELSVFIDRKINNFSLKLINLLGEVVTERNDIHSNSCTINVSPIAKGIYIAELSINGNKARTRICKE